MNRDPIFDALFERFSGITGLVTMDRRWRMWTDLDRQTQLPALFQREVGEDYPARPAQGLPPRRTLHVELWLYTKLDPAVANDPAGLNAMLDLVEAALAPPPGIGRLTLGGLVYHCWIEGQVDKDPGDLDGVGKAVVPIRILVP